MHKIDIPTLYIKCIRKITVTVKGENLSEGRLILQTWSADRVNMDFQGKEKEDLYFRSKAGRGNLLLRRKVVRYVDEAPGTESQITSHWESYP